MAEKWEEQIFWKDSENEWENIKTYELLNRYIRIIWKKASLKRTGNRVRQDISQRKAEDSESREKISEENLSIECKDSKYMWKSKLCCWEN